MPRGLLLALPVALLLLLSSAPRPVHGAQQQRQVNWWFNIFNAETADHVVEVAEAHRPALTGVVQYVQPGGFVIHGGQNWCPPGTPAPCAGRGDSKKDPRCSYESCSTSLHPPPASPDDRGSSPAPPHGVMVNATARLLALGLEVGVVATFLPPGKSTRNSLRVTAFPRICYSIQRRFGGLTACCGGLQRCFSSRTAQPSTWRSISSQVAFAPGGRRRCPFATKEMPCMWI